VAAEQVTGCYRLVGAGESPIDKQFEDSIQTPKLLGL